MKTMNRTGAKRIARVMSIVLVALAALPVQADEPGPFERMFRAIRHAVREPQHHSVHRKHKPGSEPANEEAPTSNITTDNRGVSSPPSERNTRSASRVAAKKGSDWSYGTPVPGKPGLVMSPYSPNSGYVDVRGFAPGTPVKDPYTGKIFLTP
jgi:hypothetical protein